MRRLILFLVLSGHLTLSFLAAQIPYTPKDLYWISFANRYVGAPTDYYLMQMDRAGRIVRAPEKVFSVPKKDDSRSATALSYKMNGNLFYWFCGKGHRISRLILEESSLRVLSIEKTDMETSLIRSFGVTQKPVQNFLAIKKDSRLRAFLLNPAGFHFGKDNWPISGPNIGRSGLWLGGFQQVGVSADGRMSWWTQRGKLMVQPLDASGRIQGAPSVIGQVAGWPSLLGTADISDVLPGGVRFVPFVWAPEDLGGTIFDHVLLRVIDALSAKPIGKATTIYTAHSGYLNYGQSLAMDPQGRFIVLADEGSRLLYIALDRNGRRVGPARILESEISAGSIDLLRSN